MTKRIWELDAARGLCILGMLVVHLLYDLNGILPLSELFANPVFSWVMEWGGSLFFLLSGICATLGSRPVRRGLTVLGCAALVSAATWVMYALRLAPKGIIIYFGVLHCLGVCMLLWPILGRLPRPALWAAGILTAVTGLMLPSQGMDTGLWLIPLGIKPLDFASSDYFPLLPFLGFFLLGAGLGRWIYARKESRFPGVDVRNPAIRFLTATGRWSLPIYILHQPVFAGLCMILEVLL